MSTKMRRMFLVIFILSITAKVDGSCPAGCTCRWHESADCSGLNLTAIPDGLDAKISKLNLSGNHLEEVNLPVNFIHLKVLDLRYNRIKEFNSSNVECCMATLEKLDLSRNLITNLSSHAFEGLVALEELNLHENRIEEIHAALFSKANLPLLRTLDLSNNNIDAVYHHAFVDQTSLEVLHFEGNRLGYLNQRIFYHLVNIRELYLGENSLSSFHEYTFARNGRLLILNLDHNLLLWDHPLFGLEKLPHLSLRHNHYKEVPDKLFARLTSLQVLYMDFNPLGTLDVNAFADNAPIEILSVSSTLIKKLPNLSILKKLKVFRASHCKITSLEAGNFPKDRDYDEIDLSDNLLTYLTNDVFDSSQYSCLNLQRNPWSCDCFGYWMVNVTLSDDLQMEFMCASPENKKGQNVIEVMKTLNSDTCNAEQYQHPPKFDDSYRRRRRAARFRVLSIVFGTLIPLFIIATIAIIWYRRKPRVQSHPDEVFYQPVKVADSMEPEAYSSSEDEYETRETIRFERITAPGANRSLGEDI